MLVAVRSFITSDRYVGEIRVVRGQTYVSEDSDLALEHPDCFAAPGRAARGSRDRIYSTMPSGETFAAVVVAEPTTHTRRVEPERFTDVAKTGSGHLSAERSPRHLRWQPPPARRVLYETATGPVRVKLSEHVRRRLVELAERDSLREDGCLLFSQVGFGNLVEIVEIAPSGPLAKRGLDRFAPDWLADRQFVEAMRTEGLVVAGQAHSHSQGSKLPSDPDLKMWSTIRQLWCSGPFIGVIISVDPRSRWTMPEFTVWSLTDQYQGAVADRCQRARIA